MGTEISYNQIYKVLLSEGIEKYIPDGVSLSHPVVDLREGRIVDCLLLFLISRDGSKYTVPTARILIDCEKKELVEFNTTEEMPFSVYDGTDYFTSDIIEQDVERMQAIEHEYQTLYMRIREIAFKETISTSEKETIIQYINSLKAVELQNILPYLYELGRSFFEWAENATKSDSFIS